MNASDALLGFHWQNRSGQLCPYWVQNRPPPSKKLLKTRVPGSFNERSLELFIIIRYTSHDLLAWGKIRWYEESVDHDRDHQTIKLKMVVEYVSKNWTIDSFYYPLNITYFKA